MKQVSNFFKFIKKNVGISVLSTCFVAAAICGVAKAVENTISDIDTTVVTNNDDNPLTNQEIDKIIEDIKISGSIDNIIDKLDEIIKRAQLSGNTALQEYATNMKKSYELQKELDSVNSLIEAMKKKNSSINSVDKEVKKILSVDTIITDLDGAVSDEALLVLKSLDNESVKELTETLAEIENFVDLTDVASLTAQQRSVLDVIVLSKIIQDDMVKDERLQLAENTLAVAITILQSYQKQEYSEDEYNDLLKGTERFINSAKKASSIMPEQVVLLDGNFNMKHPPIMYDGHILMAIDDLYQYIDASAQYMYNNATVVITSPDKTLEIVRGKNVAYLNDTPYSMPVPILSFEDTIYMSVEFFATAYDISYKFIENQDFIVLYKNLVQLENPSVPNQINRG